MIKRSARPFIAVLVAAATTAAAQTPGRVGVGTQTPLARLHVSSDDSIGLLLDNTTNLAPGVANVLSFKVGNWYTGRIRTYGTGSNTSNLGFFTYAATDSSGLRERLTITDDGGVGIGTDLPDPSALLDLRSTTQGLLLPRMTSAERAAIPAPATGLTVYQTDASPGFYYYNGNNWQSFTTGKAVTPTGFPTGYGLTSTVAGSGAPGSTNGPAATATFSNPLGVGVDAAGAVYVADLGNHRIRKITPDGIVSTLAGSGAMGSTDGGSTTATFNNPYAVAPDLLGNVYVADAGSNKIRKVTAAGNVSTVAGTGSAGSTDGSASAATFSFPTGIAVDPAGTTIYVADQNSRKIRVISGGVVSTLAGTGASGSIDGPGSVATFSSLRNLALDAAGNLYVSDANKIRKVTPAGVVSTFAGSGAASSVNGVGTAASFNTAFGVAVDDYGNVFVSEQTGNRLRRITPAGVVTNLAGHAGSGGGGTDGIGVGVSFAAPKGIAIDAAGNVYVADQVNNKVRKVQTR